MKRSASCAFVLGVFVSVGCGSDDASGTAPAGGGGTGNTAASGGGSGRGGAAGSGGAGSGGQAGSDAGAAGGVAGSSGTGGQVGASGGGNGGESGSGAAAGAAGTNGTGPLPEGNSGIAVRHPGDAGIGSDSAVIFADDFESYSGPSALSQRWDAVYQSDQIRIATETENVHSGSRALEFTVPRQTAELSNAVDKVLSPERDVLFLRYYSKFQPPYDVVGSSHNGSSISAHYFVNGQATPGVPADGTNKFLANLENWRGEAGTASPGHLNVYIYHPDQRSQWGDHLFPTGRVLPNSSQPYDFGPGFAGRPDVIPNLGQWYCYELMVQANTPGQRDGRIAVWLDGKLTADFQNLRLRDVATLKIDRFQLSFHIGSNPNAETKKWYDDVVAATSYIGPRYMP